MKKFPRPLLLFALFLSFVSLFSVTAFAESALHSAFYNDVDGDGEKELVPLLFRGPTTITKEYYYTQSNCIPFDMERYNGPTAEDDIRWDELYMAIWDTYEIDPYDEYETLGKEKYGEESDEYRKLCADCEEFLAFDETYNERYSLAYTAWQADLSLFLSEHPEVVFGHTVNPDLTTTVINENDALLYWLHVPYDYDPEKKYPVFVYAHGEDQSLRTSKYLNPDGTLNVDRLEPFSDSGFNTIFGKWYEQVKNPGDGREKYDCFIIYIMNTNEFFRGTGGYIGIVNQYNDYGTPDAYQLTADMLGDNSYKATYSRVYDASKLSPGYQEQLVCQLIDTLAETYSIDLSRQYVAGFSLGGILTMDIISHYPDRFACAVPICSASADISEENAKALTYTNVWAFSGNGDGTCNKYFSKLFVEAINAARTKFGTGPDHIAQYSFFPGGHSGGHAKCSVATASAGVSTTSDLDLLNFIFSSKREPPREVCRVGNDTFGTLEAAMAFALENGEEIVLLSDIENADFRDHTLTLDLSSHNLCGHSENAAHVTILNTGTKKATLAATGLYGNDVSAFAADGYDAKTGDPKSDNEEKNCLFRIGNDDYRVTASVSAAERNKASKGDADRIDVRAGDTVTVTIRVDGARFVAADMTFGYDGDRFSVLSADPGWTENRTENGFSTFRFAQTAPEGTYYPAGTVLGTFVFKVVSGTEESSKELFGLSDFDIFITKSWSDVNDKVEPVPLNAAQLTDNFARIRMKPVTFCTESSRYVCGWNLLLVYTNDDVPGFLYQNSPMYEISDLGYRFGIIWNEDRTKILSEGTSYDHVYAILLREIPSPEEVRSSHDPAGEKYVLSLGGKERADVNQSDSVDINDLVAVAAIYNVNGLYLNDPARMSLVLCADISGDGTVDTYDCALIQQFRMEKSKASGN